MVPLSTDIVLRKPLVMSRPAFDGAIASHRMPLTRPGPRVYKLKCPETILLMAERSVRAPPVTAALYEIQFTVRAGGNGDNKYLNSTAPTSY